ncbi:hypothetical protein Runsl_1440 [Runella slithyformis DSM 19594]|uniref:Uncharacterized protein n=1 Tax=Runella slithyformis (strain ATCC 29530 / DSM 19594 / LMG 11500 / NCIMB 11436 / LSU 4) TaxID=761193 RepID=A0A7U3ZIJ4_RUNSL|nr:hypothetical protein Runsl_1440 [Runella slithyformis DSM 19594]
MKRKPLYRQLSSMLSMTIGLAYLGGGLFLVASSATFGMLPSGLIRYLFGAMLIVYGGYRSYRGYVQYQNDDV